jgi:hypothetical protein
MVENLWSWHFLQRVEEKEQETATVGHQTLIRERRTRAWPSSTTNPSLATRMMFSVWFASNHGPWSNGLGSGNVGQDMRTIPHAAHVVSNTGKDQRGRWTLAIGLMGHVGLVRRWNFLFGCLLDCVGLGEALVRWSLDSWWSDQPRVVSLGAYG